MKGYRETMNILRKPQRASHCCIPENQARNRTNQARIINPLMRGFIMLYTPRWENNRFSLSDERYHQAFQSHLSYPS